jgi:hypothetical protein
MVDGYGPCGVAYHCYAYPPHSRRLLLDKWNPPQAKWGPSPSESYSLYSFWLGRDSDALLEWPPNQPEGN